MGCLRRLSKLQESAKTFIDTHFHDMNAILELAEVLGTAFVRIDLVIGVQILKVHPEPAILPSSEP